MEKAVIITAGTKRVGLALTKKSLELGYSVITHYRTSASQLKRWLNSNSKYKNNVYFIQSDLRNSPENLIIEALKFNIPIVGLINNASTFKRGNLTDINNLAEALEINSFIPLKLSDTFRKKVKKGWIINVTDAYIESLNSNFQNYRISKLFLQELTRQMAFTYAPKIRVNAIAPGPILQAADDTLESFKKVKRETPLKKKELLSTVLKSYEFLISCDGITGQTIYADGGRHLV